MRFVPRIAASIALAAVAASASCTVTTDCACDEECGATEPGPRDPKVIACVSTCKAECADHPDLPADPNSAE